MPGHIIRDGKPLLPVCPLLFLFSISNTMPALCLTDAGRQCNFLRHLTPGHMGLKYDTDTAIQRLLLEMMPAQMLCQWLRVRKTLSQCFDFQGWQNCTSSALSICPKERGESKNFSSRYSYNCLMEETKYGN